MSLKLVNVSKIFKDPDHPKKEVVAVEGVNLEIQAHIASKDQGRIDSLRWLVRVIKDIRDGKISLKTPLKSIGGLNV